MIVDLQSFLLRIFYSGLSLQPICQCTQRLRVDWRFEKGPVGAFRLKSLHTQLQQIRLYSRYINIKMINNEKSNFKKLGGIDNPVLINILQYIHPNLHCLISRQLQTYAHGKLHHNLQTSIQHQLQPLPVSLLISLNSIKTLESFKVVLQGHKFNYESFSRACRSIIQGQL